MGYCCIVAFEEKLYTVTERWRTITEIEYLEISRLTKDKKMLYFTFFWSQFQNRDVLKTFILLMHSNFSDG